MRSLRTVSSLAMLLSAVVLAGLLRGGARDGGEGPNAGLIRDLSDRSFVKREAASAALLAMGEEALPALRHALRGNPDLETRRRAQRLVRAILLAASRSKSLGLKLAVIDGDEFQMGSRKAENSRRLDEPEHRVRITETFLLGIHEVTQDEYQRVMKANPSWFSKDGPGKDRVATLDTGRFPVERVSWYDAIDFCNRLSEKDGYKTYYKVTDVKRTDGAITGARVIIAGGNGYRLPTEAEWEFACRAGTTTPFHFGFTVSSLVANVNSVRSGGGYGGPAIPAGLARTTKVGSYAPNRWGLYDMHGNVAEWCWDWYAQDYYNRSPVNDPRGPGEGTHRILRGGSWLVSNGISRSASRTFLAPADNHYYVGLRVARTP